MKYGISILLVMVLCGTSYAGNDPDTQIRPAVKERLENKIKDGTCYDTEPGVDFAPMIGAAAGAAIDGGSGVSGALIGTLTGDTINDDHIDLGTLLFGGIGAALGGPGGAALGVLIGDYLTDTYNYCEIR